MYRDVYVFCEQRDGMIQNIAFELMAQAMKVTDDTDLAAKWERHRKSLNSKTMQRLNLHSTFQIEPNCYLATIKRLLLNDTDRNVRFLTHERLLIGTVRKEITLHHVFRTQKFRHCKDDVLGSIDALQLTLERFFAGLNV